MEHIVQQAQSPIHVPSTLETLGLFRDVGNWPNGITLVPWLRDQTLVWNCFALTP